MTKYTIINLHFSASGCLTGIIILTLVGYVDSLSIFRGYLKGVKHID